MALYNTLYPLPAAIPHYGTLYADRALPLSLAAVIAAYWRVRSWQVTMTRHVVQPDGNAWPPESYDLTLSSPASTEYDLAKPATYATTWTASQNASYTSSNGSVGSVGASASVTWGTAFQMVGGQIYAQPFSILIGEHNLGAGSQVADGVNNSWYSSGSQTPVAGCIVKMPGDEPGSLVTHALYVLKEPVSHPTYNVHVEIAPKTYWGWGGKYNTATGAPA